jgi:hypothetical protein
MAETRAETFSKIFHERRWGGTSVSGPGSAPSVTGRLRSWLPEIFQRYNIKSLNDAPCGDVVWIQELLPLLRSYHGFDIVKEIIDQDKARNTFGHCEYSVADVVTEQLPTADAIFCRDCIVHLSLDEGRQVLKNFKDSKSRYLIATTFPRRENVEQKKPGAWRPLDLERSPFTLGRPIETFFERMPNRNDPYNDKALGIWALSDLI